MTAPPLLTRNRRAVAGALVLAVFVWHAGPRAAERDRVEASWIVDPPVIDGNATDWAGALVPLTSSAVSLGVRNDGTSMYVAVVTSDPGMRRLLGHTGLTVWFDATRKDRKASGLVVPSILFLPPRDENGKRRQRPPLAEPPAPESIGHVEVIGPDKDDHRRLELSFTRRLGVDAAAGINEGVLTYEMRVPLAADDGHPYAAGTTPGALIALGLESRDFKLEDAEGGRGRGMPGMGGGMPGMGGGMGRGGTGRGDAGRGDAGTMRRPTPLKTWIDVRLEASATR